MELSMRELNELIYCIDVARKHGQLLGTTVADNLAVRLRDELDSRLEMELWDNTLLDGLDDLPMDKLKSAAERYSDEVRAKHNPVKLIIKEKGWITQAILDYVDIKGNATYKELNDYYKSITGSNSFSHHVYNLITPYKNRPTQRYLVKTSNGKYEVRIANIHNWVVLND
jgi:hypothetical protein